MPTFVSHNLSTRTFTINQINDLNAAVLFAVNITYTISKRLSAIDPT